MAGCTIDGLQLQTEELLHWGRSGPDYLNGQLHARAAKSSVWNLPEILSLNGGHERIEVSKGLVEGLYDYQQVGEALHQITGERNKSKDPHRSQFLTSVATTLDTYRRSKLDEVEKTLRTFDGHLIEEGKVVDHVARPKKTVKHTAVEGGDPKSRPVIAIIGCMGRFHQELDRYARMWEKLGFQTMRANPTIKTILNEQQARKAAFDYAQTLAYVVQPGCSKRPLIFHIISWEGFLFFGQMMLAINKEHQLRRRIGRRGQGFSRKHSAPMSRILTSTSAMIFECAPGKLSPQLLSQSYISAVTGDPAWNVPDQYTTRTKLFEAYFVQWKLRNRKRIKKTWKAWQTMAPVCPQLYLYSKKDEIVDPGFVENFMSAQESRGCTVNKSCWPNCPHTGMIRIYYEDFLLQIRCFIQSLELMKEGQGHRETP
ncbi:hypothetical protein BSKO_06073 [Bryopsis sp. KO-2023]|nr:hypothetical protein BSKO_06073 [Bryopsis sp. KO-2023]